MAMMCQLSFHNHSGAFWCFDGYSAEVLKKRSCELLLDEYWAAKSIGGWAIVFEEDLKTGDGNCMSETIS
jgi:hypothetical protein